jgi:hypothetical protein
LLRLQPTKYLTRTKSELTLQAKINTFLPHAKCFRPIGIARWDSRDFTLLWLLLYHQCIHM